MIETPSQILCHHADADAVDSFLAYRKKHKRSPLSERGAKMLAKSLMEINAAGGDASEALDVAQERGWQTIKKEWYFNDRNGNSQQGNRDTNAGSEQAAIAARFARTPDGDCF